MSEKIVKGDIIETYTYNEQENRMYIERVQDVAPILEANKRAFDVDDKSHKSEVFNHVATIPVVVLEEYWKQTGIDLRKPENAHLLRRWLDDPDNRYFRTKPGKLSR